MGNIAQGTWSDIDFATTASILSMTSLGSLLGAALSLENQVLCSNAEMMQIKSRYVKAFGQNEQLWSDFECILLKLAETERNI